MYAHAKAAGFLYQAHLRAAVRERLPWVEWGPVRNGMAEIAGVPEGVLREFSTRRRQMLERERELAAAGVTVGPAGRERVAHDTRAQKRYGIETAPWRDVIRARAAEHGFGARELTDLVTQTPRVAAHSEAVERAEAARLASPTGLTEKHNSFRTRQARESALGADADPALPAFAGQQLLNGLLEPLAVLGATLVTLLVAEPAARSASHRIPPCVGGPPWWRAVRRPQAPGGRNTWEGTARHPGQEPDCYESFKQAPRRPQVRRQRARRRVKSD